MARAGYNLFNKASEVSLDSTLWDGISRPSFTGKALRFIQVNATENGFELVNISFPPSVPESSADTIGDILLSNGVNAYWGHIEPVVKTATEWATAPNPDLVLNAGIFGISVDGTSRAFKIGDGDTPWKDLPFIGLNLGATSVDAFRGDLGFLCDAHRTSPHVDPDEYTLYISTFDSRIDSLETFKGIFEYTLPIAAGKLLVTNGAGKFTPADAFENSGALTFGPGHNQIYWGDLCDFAYNEAVEYSQIQTTPLYTNTVPATITQRIVNNALNLVETVSNSINLSWTARAITNAFNSVYKHISDVARSINLRIDSHVSPTNTNHVPHLPEAVNRRSNLFLNSMGSWAHPEDPTLSFDSSPVMGEYGKGIASGWAHLHVNGTGHVSGGERANFHVPVTAGNGIEVSGQVVSLHLPFLSGGGNMFKETFATKDTVNCKKVDRAYDADHADVAAFANNAALANHALTADGIQGFTPASFALKEHSHASYSLVGHLHSEYSLLNHVHGLADVYKAGFIRNLLPESDLFRTRKFYDATGNWSDIKNICGDAILFPDITTKSLYLRIKPGLQNITNNSFDSLVTWTISRTNEAAYNPFTVTVNSDEDYCHGADETSLKVAFGTVTGQTGNIRITKTGVDLRNVHRVIAYVMTDIGVVSGANARIFVYNSTGVELANCNPVVLNADEWGKIDLDLDYVSVSIDNTKAKIEDATIIFELDKGSVSGNHTFYVSGTSAIAYTLPEYDWIEAAGGSGDFYEDSDGDLVPL